MDPLHHDSSSYINDPDFHSGSPSSVQINISPEPAPFDPIDFPDIHGQNFPPSSSYNGSYHNSPYSGHSELSFGDNEPLNLFDDPQNEFQIQDYDPSDYDAPNSGLLMFDSSNFSAGIDGQVSVSVIPAPDDHRSSYPFDYSSPSSNGGAESGPDGERSRASSVSSNHQHASPRLEVAQTLENMSFRSPHWGTNPLPSDRPISPPSKPHSPPHLMIPDAGSPGPSYSQSPPIINAPSGDGGSLGHGPSLNIVPATPISGIGSVNTAVPYQQTMESQQQGQVNGQQSTPQGWNPQNHSSDDGQTLGVSHFRDQAQPLPFTFPQHSHSHGDVGQRLSTPPQMQSQPYNNQATNENTADFLFPLPSPRVRSKSDTSLHQWTPSPFIQDRLANETRALDDGSGTVNMNDVLSAPHQQSTSFSNLSSSHLNFAPPSSLLSANFLSPDMGAPVRRSKSDVGSGPRGHRPSRSEDVRHSGTLLYPPISQQSAAQDYLRHPQFLHPQEPVPSIHRHMRRASSGSRGSRADWSNPSSTRPSPYPSPHASPSVPYEDLPNDVSTVTLSGRELQVDHGLDVGQESDQGVTSVSKPNVTTGRTANASHKRRKQEANFRCPVPGCGSTFTRSFNLKGHLRSHNEEKPFLCKWPGCNKGFARQHDCKRHEQLHSNYRPFICEGCAKPFARMDALNRHLKSEGGSECMRLLAESGRDVLNPKIYRQPPPPPLPSMNLTKVEGDYGVVVL